MSGGAAANPRFSRDVWWNLSSLAVAGVLGILLNTLIGVVYGTAALGIFNQVFVFYLVASQLAALGLHYSAMTHIAAADDAGERRAIATSAVLATLVTGSLFAAVLWGAAGLAGALEGSPEVARGIAYVAPGVLFFALSKVALGCLNGLGRMRLYAVLFALRFVFMVAGFLLCAALGVARAALPVILSIAEAAVFLACLPALRAELGPVTRAALGAWICRHVRYGLRGFMSGMFAELNTRVDILILGAFADDRTVGVYSFAAILAEGVYQVAIALRNNYAPIVIREWAAGRRDALAATIRRARDRIYLGAALLGALSIAGYFALVPLVTRDAAIAAGWPYFAVLIAGMVASAGYAPFLPLLLYAGRPGWHSVLMLVVVASNAIANLAFISILGPLGSALGSALAFVLGAVTLRVMTARLLALRI